LENNRAKAGGDWLPNSDMFNSKPDALDRKESMGPIFNELGPMEFEMGGRGGWGQFENEASSGDTP
jgi:hypothetical protein